MMVDRNVRLLTTPLALFLLLTLFGLSLAETFPAVHAAGTLSTYLPIVPKNAPGGFGIVTGKAIDARDGSPIDGAFICPINGACEFTDENGNYTFPVVAPGLRWYTADASPLYAELTLPVEVVGSQVNILNFALSPDDLEEGQYRIVVTWGDDPKDLDAHLWIPDLINNRQVVYFDNRGNCDATQGPLTTACLDKDERQGFGPETISILEAQIDPGAPGSIGTYHFGVHRFEPGCELPGPPWFEFCPTSLHNSGAKVQVYDLSGLRQVFNIPNTNPEDKFFWYVFRLEYGLTGEQSLTAVNCFTDIPNPVDNSPVCPP